jgi:hypothetical protein
MELLSRKQRKSAEANRHVMAAQRMRDGCSADE